MSADLVSDPAAAEAALGSWAFSGEPECAPGGTAFGTNDDHGLGSVAVIVNGHFGHAFLVTANDALGAPYLFSYTYVCPHVVPAGSESDGDVRFDDAIKAERCGSLSRTVPSNMARAWQSSTADPDYLIWTDVDTAYVNEATAGDASARKARSRRPTRSNAPLFSLSFHCFLSSPRISLNGVTKNQMHPGGYVRACVSWNPLSS